MLKKILGLTLVVALLVIAVLAPQVRAQDQQVFYFISHGDASDPFWAFVITGIEKAKADLGVEVRTSFHAGDAAAQKEAFTAAIAAGANGIATSSPTPGLLTDVVADAKAAGIPVVYYNTDDPDSGRDAYVGADNFLVGVQKAQYLVDNGLVEAGDFVYMPVEVPGATYGVLQTEGVATIFDPMGITYEAVDAQYDPAAASVNMIDYMTANRDKVAAVIALGDLTSGQVQYTFDQVGIAPGEVPVVGWGNSLDSALAVKAGYIQAAMWQYAEAQGYVPIVLLNVAADGGIIGYDVFTMAFYTQENADQFIAALGG